MAGVYIHIPFCKQACHYCDFHFSTSLQYKDEVVQALSKELLFRKGYLENESVETIYFGGGTPSVLSGDEIQKILDQVFSLFQVTEHAEITLEANPDDLHPMKLKELRHTSINRFSIGVQSFFDEDLHWMNRVHSAEEAYSSVKRSQDTGFENLTLDLIYGFPLLSQKKWAFNIERFLELSVPHLSCYSLTVEDKTALATFVRNKKEAAPNEEQSAQHFEYLMQEMKKNNFLHYEISNFCREGFYSRHNSNYWAGKKYIGIGPSAHSFNGESRQWNVANNHLYMNGIFSNNPVFEMELLDPSKKSNEYLMTSLRTMWGCDLTQLEENHRESIKDLIINFRDKNWIEQKDSRIILTDSGKLFADKISSDLFFA